MQTMPMAMYIGARPSVASAARAAEALEPFSAKARPAAA